MRTNFCPHCASDRVFKIEEKDGSHFHECGDCQEAWEHYEKNKYVINDLSSCQLLKGGSLE